VQNTSTIQRLVECFRETGSIGEKRRFGRLSVLSNDSLEDIRARLLQSPRKVLRKLSQQTGMTYGSVKMATKRLKLHPDSPCTPWVASLLDHLAPVTWKVYIYLKLSTYLLCNLMGCI
jgi:hypothetical protein